MTVELPWLIMGGVAAALGGLALVNRARDRKRRAAFAEYSVVRGFTFEAQRADWERRYANVLDVFSQGRRRTWGNTISGTKNNLPFTAFEYRWVTGGGKHSQTHHIGGVVWELNGAVIPKFSLTPEGWLSRISHVFGLQDIDFDDSADFSKQYQLQGPDEAAIRKLFTPELRRFFESTPQQQVAGGGPWLLWYRHGRLPSTDELDEFIELGDQVRRRFST
jgi:hypothetical protein